LLILFLVLMILVVKRIPGDYVASLKRSVLRRVPIERAYDSLVSLEANFIVDQYRKVVAESDDRFGYLYILNIVRNSYSSELDFILARLVDNEDREVRRETVTVVGDLGLVKLSEDLERLFERETDPSVRKACLKVTAQWGPSSGAVVRRWMALALPADLRKHVLAIAFRSDRKGLEVAITREVMERLESQEAEDILSGIWLVGELELTDLKERIRGHFGIEDPRAFDIITGAISKLLDFDLFTDYLTHIGYEHIRNYETLNRNLAMFGSQSFRIISDMIAAIIGSRSYSELEKCLHTLQFIPSQESLDFLGDILFRHDVPVVRKEALNCVAKIKKENPDLDYSVFLEKLPSEIKRCKEYCRYYRVIRTWNRDSILLIELARNIEHRVWIIFKIMDMFNPDLAVFDSYYRITQISRHQIGESHVKAKSIEYLESLIKTEHTEFLSLLDAIVFEDGFFSDVGLSPDPSLDVVGVYEHIMLRSYYWLQVSAILDMPEPVKERYGSIAKETENMIPVLEKIHFLRRVSLFKGFSVMEMIIIAQITQDVKFDTDHVLFKAGDPGDALYIILEGRVHILNEKGGLLNELEPPQCFGEIAVLDKGGRAATAVCVEDCRMLVISSNDFQEILERYPILYKNIVFILTGWLRENRS
jgi:hypothetical protein